jgi:hypothetical protein
MAKTSDRVSSIAGRYANLTPNQLAGMTATGKGLAETTEDIKSMAASLLRQDENKGLRGFLRRLTGKGDRR